jgi:hypothetical protein
MIPEISFDKFINSKIRVSLSVIFDLTLCMTFQTFPSGGILLLNIIKLYLKNREH